MDLSPVLYVNDYVEVATVFIETNSDDCSHCGDTSTHCVGCGACPTGNHWDNCPIR